MSSSANPTTDRTTLQALRETLRFVKDPLGTLVYFRETWGDIVPLPLPGARVVQFTLPEHVSALLRLPIKDETTRSMRDIMGHGLLTGDGPEWRRNRRMITPAFSQKAVAPFFDVIRGLTAGWIARVRGQERELDMTEEMLSLTLDVILKTVFGGAVDIDRDIVARGMEDYFVQFALDNAGWRRLVPRFIVTPGRRRRIQAMRELDEVVYQSIAQRRQGPEGSDLLYFMLQARDEQGQPLADSALRDEVLTLVLAGHETTAETLTYALWLLAQRPAIQAELHDEVSAAVAAHGMGRESIMACKLLNAVLDETLRLYPPAYIVAREAHEDCEIGGYPVEKGTQLLAPAWAIHRDERWWKLADAFRPERWLNGETSELPAGAYFPFGGGPRLCIGKHFAKFEAAVVLMALVHELEFRAVDSYQLALMPSVTLRPREGIRLQVSTRTSIIGEELHHDKVREAPGAHAGHAHATELR